MIRRHLSLLLLVLTLLPVPVSYFLGERGFRSLESADLRLRGEQVREAFLQELRGSLDALCGETELPLVDLDRVAVLDAPAGEFLVKAPLLRARALREEGRLAEALDALDAAIGGRVNKAERAAAMVLAGELLIEAGQPERANSWWDQVRAEAPDEELSPEVARWLELKVACHDKGGRAIGERLADWCDELRTRPTSLEELVLIRELLRSAGPAEPLARFLEERLHWPDWCAELRQRLLALEAAGACLVRTSSGWFVSDERQQSFRRVERLEPWVGDWTDDSEASAGLVMTGERQRPGQPTLAGVATSGDLTIDWGASGVQFELPPSDLFGRFNPRILLLAGLALYALLSVLLVAAITRQQRRAEQLVAARGDLIAQVTHELRTPLAVLRMYGETLLAGRIPGTSRQEYLETIVSESERLGALIDRIAAVAREEPPQEDECVTDLMPTVRQVVRQYHAVAATAGGYVRLEPEEGPQLPLRIDANDFRLMLEVLVDNAVRYGGTPAEVVVRHSSSGGRLNVDVCDRGEGLESQEREAVFERWVRGRAGKRSGSRGAGMGLHLSRKLARQHGGDVTLEAGQERGAIARLWLPLSEEGDSSCSAC